MKFKVISNRTKKRINISDGYLLYGNLSYLCQYRVRRRLLLVSCRSYSNQVWQAPKRRAARLLQARRISCNPSACVQSSSRDPLAMLCKRINALPLPKPSRRVAGCVLSSARATGAYTDVCNRARDTKKGRKMRPYPRFGAPPGTRSAWHPLFCLAQPRLGILVPSPFPLPALSRLGGEMTHCVISFSARSSPFRRTQNKKEQLLALFCFSG